MAGVAGRTGSTADQDPVRASNLAFDEALFAALHAMAVKSPRFQADVQAAMRSGELTANPTQVAASLERLALGGRVSNLIQLGDGGLLITVAV